nr:hypothetical protein [Nitrososphaeria archaeon]NIN53718.1 hypothetical protein [Nitrososphaeria archaeon]NIQ34281.1 hypothetical protein [Nitrososphaeria archaeon]
MKFFRSILLSLIVTALLSLTLFQYVPIARGVDVSNLEMPFTTVWADQPPSDDTTPPDTSLTSFSPDPTNDNTPRYSGSATDDMSDVVDIEYRVDGEAWRNVDPFTPARSVSFTFTTPTLSDGTHTIRTRAKDDANNWETSYASDTITVDTTSPPTPTVSSSTHPNVDRWYSNNDPSFTWTTPSDDSGIEGYSYSLDQSPSTTPDRRIDTTGNSVSYSNKDDRIWYFHVRAQDRAGNWGPADHYGVRIDTEEPSASISINEDAVYTDSTSVTLTLSYSDALSGVKDCQYRNQGGSWTSWESCRSTKSWDLTSGDESKTVYYQVRDNAENIERVSASIILDTGGPPRPAISSSTHQNEDNWYSNN